MGTQKYLPLNALMLNRWIHMKNNCHRKRIKHRVCGINTRSESSQILSDLPSEFFLCSQGPKLQKIPDFSHNEDVPENLTGTCSLHEKKYDIMRILSELVFMQKGNIYKQIRCR